MNIDPIQRSVMIFSGNDLTSITAKYAKNAKRGREVLCELCALCGEILSVENRRFASYYHIVWG